VFRHSGSFWGRLALHYGNTKVRAEPFGAAEIDLSLIWVP